MKLLILLILINSAQSSVTDKFKLNNDYENVGNYLNKLISDYNSKNEEIHDVAVINLMTQNSQDMINEVVHSIPDENPIRIPRIEEQTNDAGIRKCGFVIVITDVVNARELAIKIEKLRLSTYWSINSRVIFITTNDNHQEILKILTKEKISNGIILTTVEETINVTRYNFFANNTISHSQNMTDSGIIFDPILFNNLNGYDINLMIHYQFPKIMINRKTINFIGKDVDLMKTIAKHLNASLRVAVIPDLNNPVNFRNVYTSALADSNVDISLNTAVVYKGDYNEFVPRILNYDEDAYCALVSMPNSKGFFEIAMRPFDSMTWILLLISLMSCFTVIIIFRCLKLTSTSPLKFLFMTYGYFFSQSSRIRENSVGIKIIYQCLIFMILILSLIYSSIITSSLIAGRDGEKYSTFNQLLDDDKLNFTVSEYLSFAINQSDYMRKILNRTVILAASQTSLSKIEELFKSSVVITNCDVLESMLFQLNYTILADKYYILPEQIFKMPTFLHMSMMNSLRDTFQYITNRAFEGGLMEYWKTMHSMYLSDNRHQKESHEMENEEFYLKMKDLNEVFYILIIGWIVSACIFLIEIFWHDCLAVLLSKCFGKKDSGRKMKNRRVKVRRIRVRPIDDEELV